MKCGSCGSELLEDSIYCMICGHRVGNGQSDVVSYADLPFGTSVTCPECGARNSRTDRWCGRCDADLEAAKKTRAMPVPKGPECPNCGVVNHENSNYCRGCGQSFVNVQKTGAFGLTLGDAPDGFGLGRNAAQREIVRERQVIMVRCKYCGSLNGPNVQKCSSCGAQM